MKVIKVKLIVHPQSSTYQKYILPSPFCVEGVDQFFMAIVMNLVLESKGLLLQYLLEEQFEQMHCPLQNKKVLQVMSSPKQETCTQQCSFTFTDKHASFFASYLAFPNDTHPVSGERGECELGIYLHDDVQQDGEKNDYCFELRQLRDKLISIEQMSHREISRLRQQLQTEKAKKPILKETASIGVNTQPDHRDEEISLLREMLKQQSLLNRQLLKQTLGEKQNIYHNIKITKN